MAKCIRFAEKKKVVSIKMPPSLVERLKEIASQEGKGYQTMVREWLIEKVYIYENSCKKSPRN